MPTEARIIEPSFFIVGAPKCGTTALATYLDGHPHVRIPDQKEPHFFAPDLLHVGRQYQTDYDAYRALFRCADPGVRRTGEASVWYYYSDVAVQSILNTYEDPRFVFMVRNPSELVQSLHGQFVYNGRDYEHLVDFEDAWRAQEKRKSGADLPKIVRPATDRSAEVFQYKKVARLGERLACLREQIPPEQLCVVVYDDFIADTAAVYDAVLGFLDLESDGRSEFPVVNSHARRRFELGTRIARRLLRPAVQRGYWRRAKSRVGDQANAFYTRAVSIPERREPLPYRLRVEMRDAFADDVIALAELLERDLSHWNLISPIDERQAHI